MKVTVLKPYARKRSFEVNGLSGRWGTLEAAIEAAEKILRPAAEDKSNGRPYGLMMPNQRVYVWEFDARGELMNDRLFAVNNDGQLVLECLRHKGVRECECEAPAYVSGGYCGRCGRVPKIRRLRRGS